MASCGDISTHEALAAKLLFTQYVGGFKEDAGIANIDRMLDKLSLKSKLE